MVVLARNLFLYVIVDVQRQNKVVRRKLSWVMNLMRFREEVRQVGVKLSERIRGKATGMVRRRPFEWAR